MARRLLILLMMLAATSACRVKKPPDAATLKQQGLPNTQVPAQWATAGAASPQASADNWLVGFGDDQLTAAVTEAILHNLDLRIAAARVEQAMAFARMVGAKLYPSVDVVARGGGQMSGDNSGLQGAALSITWEVDLWARVRNAKAAASADARATESDYEFARQSIAAAVAKNWFLAIEAGMQAEVARGTIQNGETLVRLAEDRSRIGVGNDEDIYVARAALGTDRDALRQIDLARSQAIRALELLLGRYPAAAAVISPQLPSPPDTVPGGLPSQLLERRPDVVAAERRVAAAFHRVGEAKAARLPAIRLTSSLNTISSELFVLQDRDNPVWSAGASLLMPIFRAGELKRQVEMRTAEQLQAVAAYGIVGSRAFAEVENALAAEIAAREREQILSATLADNRRALEIVQTQYKVGSTDLRYVNQRQLALNATQAALIRVQTEQRVQRVNLHLALGGSFEMRPPPEDPPPAKTTGKR